MSAQASVLFDAPGPIARRRILLANLVALAAVLAVVDDVWPLTTTGVAMMIVSAVYTLAMAELQYQGVRRA